MTDSSTFGAPEAFAYLTKQGYSPIQAAAIVGNIQQESGFNPASVNQKEGAEGLVQWRLDRLDNLKNFAAGTGRSYTDPTAQLDFIGREMTGPEAKSGAAFMQATDLPSANAALKNYIRYGDNSQDTRLKYASSVLGWGNPSPTAPQNNAPAASPQPPLNQNLIPPAFNQVPQAPPTGMPAYGWSPGQQQAPQAPVDQPKPAQMAALRPDQQLAALFHPSLRPLLFRG